MKIERHIPSQTIPTVLTDVEMKRAFLEEQHRRDLEFVKDNLMMVLEHNCTPDDAPLNDAVLKPIAARFREHLDNDYEYKEQALDWVLTLLDGNPNKQEAPKPPEIGRIWFASTQRGGEFVQFLSPDNIIAHIYECGAFELYTEVPAEVERRITNEAKRIAEIFRCSWSELGTNKQIRMLEDRAMNRNQFEMEGGYVEFCKRSSEQLLALYTEYICINKNCTMPE